MTNNSALSTIVGLIVAIAVIGGVYYYATEPDNSVVAPTYNTTNNVVPTPNPASPTPEPTPNPSPTPSSPVVKTENTSFVSQSSVIMNGVVNPSGAQTSYWYEYGETQNLGKVAGTQLLGGGYANHSAPTLVTGLKANTIYYFRINAQNSYGQVSGGILNFKTNTDVAVPHLSPSIATNSISNISATTATVHGSINPNSSATNYWVEYGININLSNTTTIQTLGSNAANTSVAIDLLNLNPNTRYYYRINAQNEFGITNGRIQNFLTKKAPAATPNNR
jgi:phosphodiesterase/alkaline phosphatase D-like protein